ncbi:MAG: hypothetical protein J6R17_09490 [Bacteroidales bacterium]|nr:hypothetical protein [Bacteroidales bacterium]
MNNTFNIKRFGNVVRRDGMSYFQNFGWTLIVLWALPVILWFLTYISMETFDTGIISNRDTKISILMWLSLMIVPSRLYKNYNDSRKGVVLAMTPASSLEKFLSMILYCTVITPIIYMLGAIAIDTILALKPGTNPYDGFIFKDFKGLLLPDLVHVGDDEMNRQFAEHILDKNRILINIIQFLYVSSIFMFTNMLFKKRKLSKTIGILTLIGIILTILIVRIASDINVEFLDDYTDEEISVFVNKVVDYFYSIMFCIYVTLSAVLLYFTYYKIKKQTY